MKSSPKNKRIVCLWFPNWPIQRLLAARPELAPTVLLLTEKTGRGVFVSFCNRWARTRGICVGMPLAEALSLVRDAAVEPIQPEADRMALEELAIGCEQFSPCVGLEEAERPHALLLDITGVAHLFGGELSLIHRLQKELIARRFEARIAIGDSVGVVWAAAHYLARSTEPSVIPNGKYELLWDVPIEGARLSQTTVEKLHRLGIQTIRQLFSLSRSSLPSRFGGEIERRLAQFTGEQPELITPCRPTPKFEVEHFLEDGVQQTDIIEPWVLMLLERLVGLLQNAQMGTRQLQCAFVTERKTKHDIAMRLCEPTADARHLRDLLRLNMERLRFESPLIGIRMEALDNFRLEQPQQELFDGRSRDLARQLSSLLNRLSSRLGQQAVVRPRLLPEAVPERAVEYVPVTEECVPATTDPTFLPLDRPTCLFSQPKSVDVIAVVPNGPPSVMCVNNVRFDIVQVRGPERIEAGWWQSLCVRRDYYQVETTEGRRFWLFRRLQDGQWFLHGGVF
jgi:protein ImuB